MSRRAAILLVLAFAAFATHHHMTPARIFGAGLLTMIGGQPWQP